MVLAFQLKADDLQGRGHAHLLDLAGLGEGRLEVDVGKPCQWVSEAMPGMSCFLCVGRFLNLSSCRSAWCEGEAVAV